MSLVIKYLPDDKPGLDNKDVLIAALRSEASNGGDTRCLCGSCLAFWALKHLVDGRDDIEERK